MIKKTILMLLVLVGGVMSANAWGDLYLICGENSSWSCGSDNGSNDNYKNDAFKFTCTSENHYRATVPGSYINSGDWFFRFRDANSDSWKNISPESESEDADITNATIATNWQNSNKKAFKILRNENAKFVHVFATFNTNTNKWEVSCSIITETVSYTVAFTNPSGWSSVYAYAFLDGLKLTTAWPGNAITETNNIYSVTVTGAENARIIFNNGSSGDTNQSWTFDLENNAVYTYNEKVGNQTISLSNDFGTYSSDYPLTFPEGDQDIQAYTATYNSGTGRIQMSRVTGVVPAKTGLFLAKKISGNASIQVAPCATVSADVSSNQMKPGTGAVPSGENCYALVKRDDGVNVTYGFVKITDSPQIPVGKAYLDANSAYAPELGFFMDDDETTTIYSLGIEQNDVENGVMYNLAGQRVEQPTKGVYILNGKKVIIK